MKSAPLGNSRKIHPFLVMLSFPYALVEIYERSCICVCLICNKMFVCISVCVCICTSCAICICLAEGLDARACVSAPATTDGS